MAKPERIQIENVLQPGKTYSADPDKYAATRKAVLADPAAKAPGMTVAELQKDVLKNLPDELFPGGATAGWWVKAVHLDLEAKGIVVREKGSPVRLHKT